jgi:hypothetical protein
MRIKDNAIPKTGELFDVRLTCRDCSQGFTFEKSEAEWYRSKGLEAYPRLCPFCRRARKLAREAEGE